MQSLAAHLPLGAARFGQLQVRCISLLLCPAGLDQGNHPGPAIDDQKQQDGGVRGAQEHREERKRRHLQAVPPPHAAAPGLGPMREAAPAGGVAVRAVIRWIAAVRLWMACSKVPAPASAARFWLSVSCSRRKYLSLSCNWPSACTWAAIPAATWARDACCSLPASPTALARACNCPSRAAW